jgi:hypothetical protein
MAPIIELFRVLLLALIGAIVGPAQTPPPTTGPALTVNAPTEPTLMGLASIEPTETPTETPVASRVPHPFASVAGESTLARRVRIDGMRLATEARRVHAQELAAAVERDDARHKALEAALAAERLDHAGRPLRVIVTEPCPATHSSGQSSGQSTIQEAGKAAFNAFWFTGVLLPASGS